MLVPSSDTKKWLPVWFHRMAARFFHLFAGSVPRHDGVDHVALCQRQLPVRGAGVRRGLIDVGNSGDDGTDCRMGEQPGERESSIDRPRSAANFINRARRSRLTASRCNRSTLARVVVTALPEAYLPLSQPSASGRYGRKPMLFAVQKGSTSSSTWRRSKL